MITISDTTYCLGVWHGLMPVTQSVFSMWVTHEPRGPWHCHLDVVNSVKGVTGKRVTINVNDEDDVLVCVRKSIATMQLQDCEEILIRACGGQGVMRALAVIESEYLSVHFMSGGGNDTIN